ncbi:MAG: glycosyltransferase family 9 protein [candidate division WOR-3 bacterium]
MKVLLVRFSSMGDVALVSSAAELLREAGHQVYLLTFRPFGELFLSDERLSVIEVKKGEPLPNILARVRGRFDVAFDLHGKLLSGAVVAMSGARLTARYDKRILARRAAVWLKRRPRFVPVHELYCQPIKKRLRISGSCPLPRLIPPANGPRLPDDFILLAPGAQHPTRSWPWFPELAEMLSARGLNIVWVGLGDEGPADVPGLDLRGKTSLQELLYVISKANALVSGDTGPMHLARCLGVPVVAIFGPTLPEFGFGPLPGQGIVLEKDLRCRPCSLHGEKPCPYGLECLSGVTPDEVLVALSRIS